MDRRRSSDPYDITVHRGVIAGEVCGLDVSAAAGCASQASSAPRSPAIPPSTCASRPIHYETTAAR